MSDFTITGHGGVRVLVLGRAQEVMETVCAELADAGLQVTGTVEPEAAEVRYHADGFDLIAFGRGIPARIKDRLKRVYSAQNPYVRLLDTFAPRAAWQILSALEDGPCAPPVDLDAYCQRIGYRGPRTPTLKTLHSLVELHSAAIVFEALDVLLGHGVDLDPVAVDRKLIASGRGGYCYEQNGLMKRVLMAMGFEVDGLIARVRWGQPPGAAPMPRSHMALRVTIDAVPWLVDVGFGGWGPSAPLRMDTVTPQATRHETFRVLPFGDSLMVQSRSSDPWWSLYELSTEPQLAADFEPFNWYTATHPGSPFKRSLMVARTTSAGRFTLLNDRLTIRRPDGEIHRQTLDVDGIEATLRETFSLPVQPAWRSAIQQAVASDTEPAEEA
ncbi:arylamine N-acetyltransferase family protein [Halomonas stenophila]|uniref:N-hydroxyarylamine O-acetyltransferase n=1 Tax=Halomonas stenophila TaxID=795312 RepID=A0A7W5ER05_9GAMM|nr:arylamine N-acetyltransferase [Halomonas stenophila]MBB3229701.1 N-hydroxyarylamine O-acetyltransferase [Halomonas stenophila]